MTDYIPGMKIRAGYWTSVYKPNLSGWRSEYVKAELEVITPKKARVTDAVMYKQDSKRQQFYVAGAECKELGKVKIISRLSDVEVL